MTNAVTFQRPVAFFLMTPFSITIVVPGGTDWMFLNIVFESNSEVQRRYSGIALISTSALTSG